MFTFANIGSLEGKAVVFHADFLSRIASVAISLSVRFVTGPNFRPVVSKMRMARGREGDRMPLIISDA